MDAIRQMALGVCVLCVAGGILQIFWPDNGYKPVINTVLVLYIVTSVLQMRPSGGRLPQINWDAMPEQADVSDYQQYAERLAVESSVQALDRLLREAGIEAEASWEGGACRIRLADAADEARARELLEANQGDLPCELLVGGDAP
ncbi:MAG TPA: hypothetical protein H9915_10675 [Candidatus Gemmiger faecigallinarum]|nr:hypothetical protein [Candidatus Gemmiger faecigallinarum]